MNGFSGKNHHNNGRRIPVLYIAGATRSGSTLISNILGQVEGFFHAGEVIEAWDRGRIWKCSCGAFPDACSVWSPVYRNLDATINAADQRRMIELRNRFSKSHKVILQRCFGSNHHDAKAAISRFTKGLTVLYENIQAAAGARVIIDSSKNAGYGFILSLMDNIDLYVVHLVRDSRAVVFSWTKKKKGLWTERPAKAAATWSSRHVATELMRRNLSGKYIKVLYEDFMDDPIATTRKIIAPYKKSTESLPFISSHQVRLKTSHGLCGNPNRFGGGTVKLKVDNRWRSLKTRDKIVTTALTWPLLSKYHYI